MSRSRILLKLLVAALVLSAGAVVWLRQQDPGPDPGAETPDGQPIVSPVDQLEWLAGCWKHEETGFRRDEQWMRPSGGTMLGMSRSVAAGRTVEHEYLRIEVVDGLLAYVAIPSGQSEATFIQAELSERHVVFEAPEHDFPQRITYERMSPRSVLAWIEGDVDGVSRVIEFPMTAVSCP